MILLLFSCDINIFPAILIQSMEVMSEAQSQVLCLGELLSLVPKVQSD